MSHTIRGFKKKNTRENRKKQTYLGKGVKNFHVKNPNGIILYQDETAVLTAYKKILAYKSYKSSRLSIPYRSIDNENIISLKLFDLINHTYNVEEINTVYIRELDKLFPSMVVKIQGYIHSFDFRKNLTLRYNDTFIPLKLNSRTKIHKEKKILKDKFVFIVGIIDSLEIKLEITAISIIT